MKSKNIRLSLFLGFGLTLALLGLFALIGQAAPGNPVLDPARNAHTVPATTTISIAYDEAISPTSVSTRTFAVHAMQTGLLTQTLGVDGATISLTPTQPLKPGELVQVSATTGTLSAIDGSGPISPTVWQFRAAVGAGSSC
jgi:hypothetical protein